MNEIEKEYCLKITKKLMSHPLSHPFLEKVDVEKYPDYLQCIKPNPPMDLKTVKAKLVEGKYPNTSEWKNDIMIIWDNAKKFNLEGEILYYIAIKMEEKTKKLVERIPTTRSDIWYIDLCQALKKSQKFLQNEMPTNSKKSKNSQTNKH